MRILRLLQPSLAALAFAASSAQAGFANFDDLPALPALDAATGLQNANNGSLDYLGVTWDSRFSVVGDQYKINPPPRDPPNPAFGIPHSGHYMVTNQNGESGLLITTNQVLTGAWFGRNEYYGYGGGSDQVTIIALSGITELAQVVFNLPETHPGEPEPLSFIDTSLFASLSGITGYRIDRHELGTFSGNWVADDFQFSAANLLPAPGVLALLASALPGFWLNRRRKQTVGQPPTQP